LNAEKDTTPVIKVHGRWTGLRDVKPPTRDYELRKERDDETGLAVLTRKNFLELWRCPIDQL
jgi:hypothetical protein